MNDDSFPQTHLAAIRYFSNPANSQAFLIKLRWPDGRVRCPRCNALQVGKFGGKRMLSNCGMCKRQFTLKVATIFEDSPLGFDKWLPALWMIVNAKNGISSCELARALGVTQKTAWFMAHRLRMALEKGSFRKMGGKGVVEVDESYIGGLARNMHKDAKERRGIIGRGATGKTAVMGLLERHSAKKKASRIVSKVIPFTEKKQALGIVKQYVLKDSELHTDAGTHYSLLKTEYEHRIVDHAEAYVKDGVHTNGLENFWSLLKRTIKGTYVHCAPFHLHRYLGEQVYRFNERKDSDAERFIRAAAGLIGKRLTYHHLLSKKWHQMKLVIL